MPNIAFWSARPWLVLLTSFAASRVLIAIVGVIGAALFVNQHDLVIAGAAALNPEVVWHKWDALWYERLATHGYGWQLDDIRGQAAAGFFPLYPLTVGVILRALPSLSFFWVAMVFSNLLAVTALALVVSRLTDGAGQAGRVMLAVVTAAGSFYLSIPYAESLFLLLVVLVMITSRRGHYLVAAFLCGLAFTTRVHGLALIAIPVITCWRDPRRSTGSRAMWIGGMAALFAIPIVVYLTYLAEVQGSALAMVEQQKMWSNALPYPFRALVGLLEFPRRISGWMHGAFWGLYVGLLIRSWRRMPLGEALFCAGALIISTQQESFQGIYRYVVPLIPLTLALSEDRPALQTTMIAINLVFGTIMILAFVTNNRLAV